MDQIKIGKFIAECRRKKGLTQMQLGEMLNITDRAVSKWERGLAMPDSSIMLELCAILGINVNELLCGEKICMEELNKESEMKLLELVNENEQKSRLLLLLEWMIGILSILMLLIPIFIGALLPNLDDYVRLIIVLSGFIPSFVGFFVATKIEQVAGYYECKECGHKYVPSFKRVTFSMHIGRTRYMKCPHCGKKSWHNKVITKE